MNFAACARAELPKSLIFGQAILFYHVANYPLSLGQATSPIPFPINIFHLFFSFTSERETDHVSNQPSNPRSSLWKISQ